MGATPLTPQQMRALSEAPDASTLLGVRDRALLHTLGTSGCRLQEILRLEQTHLVAVEDFWQLCILGTRQVQPRRAPLSIEAYTWIQRWLQARSAAGVDVPRIFTRVGTAPQAPTAQPLSASQGVRRLKRYGRQIGLPHLGPNDVRRFVGVAVAARHGLRAAQLALGHAHIETTRRFVETVEKQNG